MRAELVLACADLAANVAFYTERLGFRVDAIFPADDPSVAVVSGHGLAIRLERGADAAATIRLVCDDRAGELVAPNGTRVVFAREPGVVLPPLRPSFAMSRARDAKWIEGRAGMRYRDLVPDRQGGRFIASHIRIEPAGPVPDYVHFHEVRFQMIFCKAGWVKVVYEDQGAPFVLRPGDCVLQPPRIRHRVLESSGALEVIEIGSPAEHETFADHELALPTATVNRERDFGGQRFVRHVAASAAYDSGGVRDLGIAAATRGLASAHVARVRGARAATPAPDAELAFSFVLAGDVTLRVAGSAPERLGEGDAFVVPAETAYEIEGADAELLEVGVPAR